MAFDHLAKICSDFYKVEEVITARNVRSQCGKKKRLPMRQGSDMCRTMVEHVLKFCLDAHNKLPTFYVVALSRLPPLDVEHCDVSAILKEL